MNIALVVHDLHEHAGHGIYAKVLADELSIHHDVTVFANRCEREPNARWTFQPVKAWRINALASVQTFPLGLRACTAKLQRFDVRHMQGYCGGGPNVVTAHICVAAYLNSLRNLKARNRASLTLTAAAESGFYRRYEGQVIAVSEKIASDLREFYKVRGEIKVIHHGVDCARFTGLNRQRYRSSVRTELGVTDEQISALYVGDLTKAHTHLKKLAAATPDVKFSIVSRSELYRWSMPNVQFLNPSTELERYYAAADAFVFPTTYDSFGMVVLEAMASRLPVFCSDRAGVAELIHSAKDGFVFPLSEWVEATAAQLRNPDQLLAVGVEAERTARRHDWNAVVRETEQVYRQVVTSRGVVSLSDSPGISRTITEVGS
jgi:UDP-glucose:(heptosyl)LPS alpha-1,3-glucosyltransferase